jgi:hypothetical protein
MQILLGQGVFYIDGVAVGLTRGGGKFTVETEYRDIEADGDRGGVEGRVYKIKEMPKIELTNLQNILTNASKYLTGMTSSTSVTSTTVNGVTWGGGTGTYTVITPSLNLSSGDYHAVSFKGQDIDGKQVAINITKAMNRENIEWEMKDKDEIINKCTYTGHYTEGSTVPPYSIYYLN